MTDFTSEALYTVGERETVISAARDFAAEQPDAVSFHRPVNFEWTTVTVSEFLEEAYAVAKGLVANGVQPGDRVCIMSGTRYEWVLVDFAIQACGAISVPIYPSSSTSQCEWIVQDSGAVVAIAEDSEHTQRLETFVKEGEPQEGTAHLRRVFSINNGAIKDLIQEGTDAGIEQDELDKRINDMTSESINSIVYTSGTTGRPKGVALSHYNWLSEVRGLITNPIGEACGPGYETLMFLPLAHVLARAVSYTVFIGGGQQTLWSEVSTLLDAFQRSQPHMILGVPRIFEKVHAGAKAKAAEAGGIKNKIFLASEKVAIEYSKAQDSSEGPSLALRAKHLVFDRLVYSTLRKLLGGRLKYCISGGSALNPELMHFFRGAGVRIFEGYGLTETIGPVSVNTDWLNKIGTVGPACPGVCLRIAEDGEVLVKGINVFREYLGNPDATAEAKVDGWFRTGDVGSIDEDGNLSITGRSKEVIVTAGGKNVSPAQLEDQLRSHPLVSQCVVIGDQKPFVAAILTLDPEMLPTWLKNNGLPEMSIEEAGRNEKVRAELQQVVDKANQSVSRAESIRTFEVLREDLQVLGVESITGGTVTVRSTLGRGTEIGIEMPLEEQ